MLNNSVADFLASFEKIKNECGNHARLLMWKSLIEEKKRSDIAENYSISERTLIIWFDKWKEKIFGDKEI